MDKIDWKRKLTSRKFWLAVISFVTSLLYAFNFSNITIEKITGIITAGAVVIAYVIGEGLADSSDTYQVIMPESEAIEEESGE